VGASSETSKKCAPPSRSSRIVTIAIGVRKNWASCHPSQPVGLTPCERPPELQTVCRQPEPLHDIPSQAKSPPTRIWSNRSSNAMSADEKLANLFIPIRPESFRDHLKIEFDRVDRSSFLRKPRAEHVLSCFCARGPTRKMARSTCTGESSRIDDWPKTGAAAASRVFGGINGAPSGEPGPSWCKTLCERTHELPSLARCPAGQHALNTLSHPASASRLNAASAGQSKRFTLKWLGSERRKEGGT
jgi:hypothetical protein